MLSSYIFPSLSRRQWYAMVALFLAICVSTQLAMRAFTAPAVLSSTEGLALAILTLEGVSLWPAVLLGITVSYLLSNIGFTTTLLVAIGSTLAPALGAHLLRRFGFSCLLDRLRDAWLFFLIAVSTSIVVPIFGFLAFMVRQQLYHIPPTPSLTFGSWWVGIITSNFLVAPLILRWAARPAFTRTSGEVIELFAAFALAGLTAFITFWTPYGAPAGFSLVYILLAPLFWLALRSGPRFLSLMLIFIGTIAVTGTMWGTHTVAAATLPLGERLFQMEVFLDILAIIFYVVVMIEGERRAALHAVSAQIKRLENVLGQIEDESKAKTDFLAVLAHELRNPLAPVVSSIELLRIREWVDKEGHPVLDVMDDSLRVVRRLLDDLLDISRISQNKLTLQKEMFHVGSIVRRAVQVLEKRFDEKRQTISIDLPAVPLMVEADPVRLEQIVTNLLVNASKFTPEGRSIAISVREDKGMAEMRVRDSGIGIEPSMIERIFEPFVQAQTQDGHHGREGLGIGLALTKRLVEAHGGTVEARSRGQGSGSEFIVRLPLARSARRGARFIRDTVHAITEPKPRIRAKRVLVVDDNVAAARAIGALLEHDGHTVDYAGTGAEAKEKTPLFKPDVEILDIGLPDTTGYDLAMHLRKTMSFDGLLVALTGYGQEEDKDKALKSGFDIHLTKPVGMKDLRIALSP